MEYYPEGFPWSKYWKTGEFEGNIALHLPCLANGGAPNNADIFKFSTRVSMKEIAKTQIHANKMLLRKFLPESLSLSYDKHKSRTINQFIFLTR